MAVAVGLAGGDGVPGSFRADIYDVANLDIFIPRFVVPILLPATFDILMAITSTLLHQRQHISKE